VIASKTISIHNYVFMDIIVSKGILSREIPIGESGICHDYEDSRFYQESVYKFILVLPIRVFHS
jgi:hypothetical protein